MSANAGRFTAVSGFPPGAQVSVFDHGTRTLATLYATRSGTTTVANPLPAGANGNLTFFAAYGTYDLVVTGGDIAETVTVCVRPDPLNVWPG